MVHAGHANTAAVFTTKYTPKGFRGVSGVIAGSVYSVLAFGGFEGAAPLAEEARNPRRTIPRAVLLVTLGIGLLYVFTTYAVDVAFGPAGFAGFMVAGVIYLVYLYARDPRRVTEVGLVHIDAPELEAVPEVSGGR